MHELAIARSLVDLVARRAPANLEVTDVVIELGALTGLVEDSLAFYFDGLTRDTPLEGARLRCRRIAARVRCAACGAEYEPDDFARVCALCGSLGGEVIAGEELNLVSIESRSKGEAA
ncbi:MAG TPA: hydrogenase maturation nickel metallochaperone HypA [Planctomycetota bacterium]|nr:hydrogenase maturation nickel metallochaperone HypA [Planctomycetota bacterium]